MLEAIRGCAGVIWRRQASYSVPLKLSRLINARVNAIENCGQWIVDIEEYKRSPDIYQNCRIPAWLFDEPGLRLILVEDERAGCVGFRISEGEIKIDSFYLDRRYQNRGLGATILKVLLAEADAQDLPVRLEVLRGSPAGRFYERHGFVKLGEDDVEAEYERAAS